MDLPASVSKGTAAHCAPLVLATPADIAERGTEAKLLAQGTITFVALDDACFGVTNEHVVRGYLERGVSETIHIALSILHPLRSESLVALSTSANCDVPFDLAVMRLDEGSIRAGGKTPARASERRLKVEDVGLAVGYPGALRQPVDKLVMDHPLAHVAATCQSSTDRSLILQSNLSEVTREIPFGGMSGGAIFVVDSEEHYELAGITYEGRGFRESEVADLAQDDVWIYGFPLTASLLRRALELAAHHG